MTGFWRRWLTVWCWGVALFGIVLVGAAFPATDGATRLLIGVMNAGPAFDFIPVVRFGFGLMGALTLCLALLVAAGVRAADDLGSRGAPVWRLLVQAVLVWYVVDSVISVVTGFPLNAASNTLLMIGFLAPILAAGVMARPATA